MAAGSAAVYANDEKWYFDSEQLEEDEAPLASDLGDSARATVTFSRDTMLNCSQHASNMRDLCSSVGIEEQNIGQISGDKSGLRGINFLDVNRNHGDIVIRGDDGMVRVYSPWLHAVDRKNEGWFFRRPFRSRGYVYGDFEDSTYNGMPLCSLE